MTSWRDTASALAQSDLDALLARGLGIATDFLGKYGEFYPFGVQLSTSGESEIGAADVDGSDMPDAREVLRLLLDGFRANRAAYRAVAAVIDVTAAGGGDALRVDLEHAEGIALTVVLPYRRGVDGYEFGTPTASDSELDVFA